MKFKSFILAALFLVSFATMHAQGKGQGIDTQKRADRMTQQMTQQLSLSEAQAAKIKVVNEKYAEQMKALRENTPDRTQLRPEMQKLRQAQEAEIATYLTAEQSEKWSKIKAQRQGQRGQARMQDAKKAKGKAQTSPRQKPMKGAKAGKGDYTQKVQKRTERMKENLNLSDEQAQQIEAIYMEYGAKKQAAYQAGTEEARASVKELRKEENKAVDAVLTPEQLKKRDDLKKEAKEKKATSKREMKMKKDKAIEQN